MAKSQRALQPSFPLCHRHIALLKGSLPRFTRRAQTFAAGQAPQGRRFKRPPELLRRIDRYAEDFRDASTVAQLTSQLVLDYAAADYGIKGSRSGRAHANLGGAALVKKLIHASGFRPMRHSSVGPSLARPIARQRPPPNYRSGTDNEASRNPGERADRRCSGQSGADEIDHGGEQGGRCIQLLLQY
jgi:hypothetical protein